MPILNSRVAIVTGGSGALGRAVTAHFIGEGARAAVPYVVDAEVPLLKQAVGKAGDDKLMLAKLDVSNEEQFRAFVDQVVAEWGKIDALVNLVGGFWGGKSVAETTLDEWKAMLDLNLNTTFLCCKSVIPAMRKSKYGRIVSVTSRSGLLGAGDFTAYAVSKGAVATLTYSLAEEVL